MLDEYHQFISKIHSKLGIDLSLYKETQMRRRITTLRAKRGFTSFDSYYNQLVQDKELINEFLDRITINVSEFYRNPKRWDVLKNTIIPKLHNQSNQLTIWSAACSTGEEPYSIAMMFKEYFPDIRVRILATDLDDNVLSQAKKGIYLEQSLKELPQEMIRNYFTKENKLYKIDDSVKRSVHFKKHNLLSDCYPKNVDLIVCRNVLIYFTDKAKERIYQNFKTSLNQGGILFVGSTEQIFNPNLYDLTLIDTFFYQKN
ncbi:CheR family methyltransferase [Oceanobacillus halophilus]|uniref:protein-glutamate O-methyltransferase n=1 Tax=Oceanobacillus halophilus TaxID=930130 RepID=A0A495ADH4_9BACI|nr:protein-glutamate O-methyltransferase CheR [Oceanobacillus halophilus]RKQ37660.1 protein-glutamate O-methyltransferase CheR [Oceanobacillus halophilus]